MFISAESPWNVTCRMFGVVGCTRCYCGHAAVEWILSAQHLFYGVGGWKNDPLHPHEDIRFNSTQCINLKKSTFLPFFFPLTWNILFRLTEAASCTLRWSRNCGSLASLLLPLDFSKVWYSELVWPVWLIAFLFQDVSPAHVVIGLRLNHRGASSGMQLSTKLRDSSMTPNHLMTIITQLVIDSDSLC